ncbi:MAG TPA: M23 family metallopeptidase [Ilumatobacteraceae bacterium]|nr:M23 family metallopeptidase [Ilumatobacteraceae bacterium]
MPSLRTAVLACALVAGCTTGAAATESTSTPSTAATTTIEVETTPPTVALSTTSSTSTTTPAPLTYVFPFTGKKVSYAHKHHDYPASDVFGCGAGVVAPVRGTIDEIRTVDPWVPKVNDPATRGGKYVSMEGDDGVRYYFAHLASVAVAVGQRIEAGDALGVMGQTGNARNSACHTHFGISWPCRGTEWAVRRGEIWPWKYLDNWRMGGQLSPVAEVEMVEAANPDACNLAALAPSAGDA